MPPSDLLLCAVSNHDQRPVSVGRTHSTSLLGMTDAVVEIEADIGNQLPMFFLIGLPDECHALTDGAWTAVGRPVAQPASFGAWST